MNVRTPSDAWPTGHLALECLGVLGFGWLYHTKCQYGSGTITSQWFKSRPEPPHKKSLLIFPKFSLIAWIFCNFLTCISVLIIYLWFIYFPDRDFPIGILSELDVIYKISHVSYDPRNLPQRHLSQRYGLNEGGFVVNLYVFSLFN